jgi:beta-lactamase regulating signal transducer with metallopeptidase domain
MTPTDTVQLSQSFLVTVVTAASRALVLGCVAGLGLTVLRVKTTVVRLFTWTAVLYVALAMPLLQRMLPPLPIPALAFRQSAAEPSAVNEVRVIDKVKAEAEISYPTVVALTDLNSTPRKPAILAAPSHSPSTTFAWSTIHWNVVAAEVYLAIALLLLARILVGLLFSRRLRRASQVVSETRMTARLATHAQALGLALIPPATESEFISVPVTMGVLRPIVLLPTSWRDWDDEKLDAVIAHEVSHIARRDTLTLRLSLLHCAIFWFSPLAWWLKGHLADLVEQASDEAALACGADRDAYATTLLGFFEALQNASGRIWWQGVSMASAGRAEQAEQRVERILNWKGTVAMSLKKSIAVLVVVLAVPVVYLTASAHPADPQAPTPKSSVTVVAQNEAPAPPPPPTHAGRVPKRSSNHNFYFYGNGDDEGDRFVIVSGNSDSLTMSGMRSDGEHVEALRKTIPGDFIWFRRDGKSYIIRDQATVSRAKAFWAPQEELGKKQEELGKQQEVLGEQQEALGAKMEQVHVKVPDMTKEIEKLQAELKQLNSGATMEQMGDIQSALGELQSKVGDVQSEAGDQQSKLGEQMGALGEKQGKLGEQQGELGRQQGELAEQATRQMKQLFDETIAKGTAQLEL